MLADGEEGTKGKGDTVMDDLLIGWGTFIVGFISGVLVTRGSKPSDSPAPPSEIEEMKSFLDECKKNGRNLKSYTSNNGNIKIEFHDKNEG